jgi:hypothetical protein
MDHLGCHCNRTILRQLQEGHVETISLPPHGLKLISPCHNSFFASLKARLRGSDTSTTKDKEDTFLRICEEYDPEVV